MRQTENVLTDPATPAAWDAVRDTLRALRYLIPDLIEEDQDDGCVTVHRPARPGFSEGRSIEVLPDGTLTGYDEDHEDALRDPLGWAA